MEFNAKNGVVGALIVGLLGYFAGLGALLGVLLVSVMVYLKYMNIKHPYEVMKSTSMRMGEINRRLAVLNQAKDAIDILIAKMKEEGKDAIVPQETIQDTEKLKALKLVGVNPAYEATTEVLDNIKKNLEKEISVLESEINVFKKMHEKVVSNIN